MIPVNPLTKFFNGRAVESALDNLFDTHLPEYGYIITSALRDYEKNKEVGGVPDSTHLYNLGRDLVLLDSAGNQIPEAEARLIYSSYIYPYWVGYSVFEPGNQDINSGKKEGYHIHLNLDREVQQSTKWLAWGLTAAAVTVGVILLSGSKKRRSLNA